MSRKTLFSLSLAFISGLGITIALGQGCAGSGDVAGLGGFTGSAEANAFRSLAPTIGLSAGNGGGYGGMVGNGGGYGGMVSASEGEYRGRHASQHSARRGGGFHLGDSGYKTYFRAGTGASCKRYPRGWENVGPLIAGEVAVSDSGSVGFYLGSVCENAKAILASSVSIVDFDSDIGVYGGAVFERIIQSPPPPESLMETVAYCRSAISEEYGTHFGMSVRIYKSGDALQGDLVIGKVVEGKPHRFAVRGFGAVRSEDASSVHFVTQGLSLSVTKGASAPVSGALSVVLDGEQLEVPMEKCW